MFWGYVNLSRHLGTDQPVYGLKSRGLDGGEELGSIEEMATQYVADLRAFEKLPRQVTLGEMRGNAALRKMKLLKNVRLLISSISDAEYQEILRMAGIVPTPGIPLP